MKELLSPLTQPSPSRGEELLENPNYAKVSFEMRNWPLPY